MAAGQKNPDILNVQYERLGEYVARQLMTDPKQCAIVQAIEMDRMSMQEVSRYATEVLQNKRVLEGNHFSKETLQRKIDNGELKSMVAKNTGKQTRQILKDRTLAANQERPSKAQAGPGLNGHA